MRTVKSLPPTIFASAVAALTLAVTLTAAVVSRDLPKQLKLIEADQGNALVVYGEIVGSERIDVEDADFPWTKLSLKVSEKLVGDAGETVTVYTPGHGVVRLSISAPETETRVGEKVVMFLRKSDMEDGNGFQLDSFAESFRTQTNRKGAVIVLGEGGGSAIAKNTKLSELRTVVAEAMESISAESQKK